MEQILYFISLQLKYFWINGYKAIMPALHQKKLTEMRIVFTRQKRSV